MPEFAVPPDLSTWVVASLESDNNILATSNQGTLLLYQQSGLECVIKTAMGTGTLRRARQATLQREANAYARLDGLWGIPRCLGMVDERYLVLEYIAGTTYRDAVIDDRQAWFDRLLGIIQGFHERGVAHGDLKSKSNLMMRDTGEPCVIDFGTTVMQRDGFHPIANRLFRYARQLDLNAWVKHKYQGRYEDASPSDKALLDYSALEKWLRQRRIRKWAKEDQA